MRNFLGAVARGCVAIIASLGTFALWTLWLALSVLVIFQSVVAVRREFAVPQWVLDTLSHRLESAGIRARFGSTTFDPAGHLLIQDVALSLPTFEEPIITVPAVYLRLDPWALIVGNVEMLDASLSGGTWFVPSMLSTSGQAEAVLSDLDLTVHSEKTNFVIDSLTAKIGGVRVLLRGALRQPPKTERPQAKQEAATAFAKNYAAFSRRMGGLAQQLGAWESPSLAVTLTPSETRGAAVFASFFVHQARLPLATPIDLHDFSLIAHGAIFSDQIEPAEITFSCSDAQFPTGFAAKNLRGEVRGDFQFDTFSFLPSRIQVAADRVSSPDLEASSFSAEALPPFDAVVHGNILADVFGQTLAAEGWADRKLHSAAVDFRGAVASSWLDLAGTKLQRNLRRTIDFMTPIRAQGRAEFAPGWMFSRLNVRLDLPELTASHVSINEGNATIVITPQKIYAPEAYARIGENFAHGTYEQDVATRDYRFILQGTLRPMAIAGWFTGWWKDLFTDITFPGPPPTASVDIRSRWGSGLDSTNFVAVDGPGTAIRGVAFSSLKTSLFIRPGNLDGLWVDAHRDGGDLHGSFQYHTDTNTGEWTELRLDLAATLPLGDIAQLLGPDSNDWLKPFQSDHAPAVIARGFLTRDNERETHPHLQVHAKTAGTFRLYEFPLENVAFDATLQNDDITLENVGMNFASGTATGRGHISGAGKEKRLGFDYDLKDANLAAAVAIVENYSAAKNARTPSPPGSFLQERTQVRINLAVSAEGKLDDPYSYHGNGNAIISGTELGQVHMLGALSDLFRFTTLRFTDAHSDFRVEGRNLVFPDVAVTGANSAIRGAGRYDLEKEQLDFAAKVFPFRESGFILQKFLAVALSPLSNVFEVKLGGSLAKPVWNLAVSGNSVLRDFPGAAAPPPFPAARPAPAP